MRSSSAAIETLELCLLYALRHWAWLTFPTLIMCCNFLSFMSCEQAMLYRGAVLSHHEVDARTHPAAGLQGAGLAGPLPCGAAGQGEALH